jgi:hypothetical protein
MKIRIVLWRKVKKKIRTIVMCWSSSCTCRIFSAQLKCTANGISVQNVNVRKKMLSVKIYRNLRRNFCYVIYFSKFHAISYMYVRGNFKNVTIWYIFGNTFTFCTDIPFAVHFNCAEKILHVHEELQHMTIVRIFFLTFL